MNGSPRGRGTDRATRGGLGVLSLSALMVGLWALFSPRSFYEDFPSPGREWVSTLGPYNGHLVVDVGAMYLALGVLLMAAAVSLGRELVRVSLVAWLVFAVPHSVYHAATLHHPLMVDKIGNVVSLGFVTLLPLVLLVLDGARKTSERRTVADVQRRKG